MKIRLCPVAKLTFSLVVAVAPQLATADTFNRINLVSSVAGLASQTDPNLINPWGVSSSPTGPFWVSNQGSATSTLYDGAGNIIPLVVAIPGGASSTAGPTGQVFNATTSFALNGAPAKFIFDNLNGTISAWNAGTSATIVATTPGAVYTGLALASSGGANYLYAADSAGQIRVFNSSFQAVSLGGNFTDPNAIAGYVPFNIQLIGSELYVTYAQLTASGASLPGGYVDVFNTDGTFASRFASGGSLNAPWGLALAPSKFGSFGGDLLIANNGNGMINAFNSTTGAFAGTLDGTNGQPLAFDDLWAIDVRAAGTNVNQNAVYFAEGINNDTGGLFGELTLVPEPSNIMLCLLGGLSLGYLVVRARLPKTAKQ